VKLDADTLSTVPDAPPAAGPDRALDPPLPAAVAEGDVVVATDMPQAAENTTTTLISAAARIRRLLLMDGGLGRAETVWWLVGSKSIMVGFPLLRQLRKRWQPFI
jgi:hypothetical protein